MRNSLFLFAFVLAIFSCSEKLPKGIIPEDQMEDILYDFHLAQTIEIPYLGDRELNQEEVMKAFYEKHNITKEDFDSSMAYYTKDIKHLISMYERIEDRMDKAAAEAGVKVSENASSNLGVKGDTLDIWQGSRLHLLTPSEFNDQLTFLVNADSSYYQHDLFHLKFMPHFMISQDMEKTAHGPLQNGLSVGLIIKYANDSVSSSIRTIYSNVSTTIMLKADSAQNIKQVYGFFCLPTKNTAPVLIDGIQLYRFHTIDKQIDDILIDTESDEETGDSVIVFTKDSAGQQRRLSPQELRNNRKVQKRVRIRKR